IIIAARPSVGKTAFALSIAVNIAFGKHPMPIGFFSLEMSGASLMERVIANKGQINLMSLRNGKLDDETNNRMMTTADALYDNASNLLIQDTPNIKLLEIRSQARRMVREDGVKAIFIDYIGLVNYEGPSTMPRHEQVSAISRSLKQLARELSVPVICLCQVNREGGKDRPPILADLRDSGSIEQDADLVILLDDPSKRLDDNGKISQYEEDDQEAEESISRGRMIKIIIAKQRNGSTGAFNMQFVTDFVCFRDIDRKF
ncbi:MAG: DnaB-like helicase C-terminal domain-containing protein, partial [Spirochaetales bacterium]|nr:DnaB-like helicase C-terminal domain-containing protein [Spirochaetales bacterium]